ncbi:MAG: GntR family transcriptional regulator [Cellulomonas sp. 73-145]|uniref:GntR family transcriptional regulator n=1 Tax=unclassified Cellulomonas TaxID=2620175 RepID=UPI000928E0E1|nr:GntR family transcriptional regulator [Cellulomonas sp. 73-145]OJV59653.1 MAG: GntR family transcriptional regulator [Cellulomonas sp. 73-145]
MGSNGTLVSRVSDDLRSRLAAGDLPPGSRLPTESELSAEFQVSRPTVRAALRELEALGLVRTQHGVGTFVTEPPAVRAGLERLDSITESIRATGHQPGMSYASRVVRPVLPEEAATMGVPGDTVALEVRRAIMADGEIVAYSYDLMPMDIFPADFDPADLDGSIFGFFRTRLGIVPDHALGEVHAVTSNHVGWGTEAATHNLFVLLVQRHYDKADKLVLYSRTYFIEGRYSFSIVRHG